MHECFIISQELHCLFKREVPCKPFFHFSHEWAYPVPINHFRVFRFGTRLLPIGGGGGLGGNSGGFGGKGGSSSGYHRGGVGGLGGNSGEFGRKGGSGYRGGGGRGGFGGESLNYKEL